MDADTPDPKVVVKAASRLQRLRTWLAPKLDIAVDEFAKEIGKISATAIIFVGSLMLASIVPGIDRVIAASLNWLQVILP